MCISADGEGGPGVAFGYATLRSPCSDNCFFFLVDRSDVPEHRALNGRSFERASGTIRVLFLKALYASLSRRSIRGRATNDRRGMADNIVEVGYGEDDRVILDKEPTWDDSVATEADDDDGVRDLLAIYSDHEAFHSDNVATGGEPWNTDSEPRAPADIARAHGASADAWQKFRESRVARRLAWEMLDTGALVSGRVAFLFERWLRDPSVKADAQIFQGDTGRDAGRRCDELMATRYSMTPDAVAAAKAPDGMYKWSVISKMVKIGNPNFKKFRETRKFCDLVPREAIDACRKQGPTHLITPVAVEAILGNYEKMNTNT